MAKFKYNNIHPKMLTIWDGKGKLRKPKDQLLQKGGTYELLESNPAVKAMIASGAIEPVKKIEKLEPKK